MAFFDPSRRYWSVAMESFLTSLAGKSGERRAMLFGHRCNVDGWEHDGPCAAILEGSHIPRPAGRPGSWRSNGSRYAMVHRIIGGAERGIEKTCRFGVRIGDCVANGGKIAALSNRTTGCGCVPVAV